MWTCAPAACIKNRDKQLHPTYTVGCNYLSLSFISASDKQVFIWTNEMTFKFPVYSVTVRETYLFSSNQYAFDAHKVLQYIGESAADNWPQVLGCRVLHYNDVIMGAVASQNHQSHGCLLNGLFRRRSKKTWKLRVTGLCAGNSPGTGEFPAQMASNGKMFPFDDVLMSKGTVLIMNIMSCSIDQSCPMSDWNYYDDVIKWEHFSRYWPFVRGIHRSPVNSPHKGQWRGALVFSLSAPE